MPRIPQLALAVLLVAGAAAGEAPDPAKTRSARNAGRQVDALFSDWVDATTPGCAVGVDHHGKGVHLKAYGLANLEHGVPLTTRSVFRLASVSKQFTAMAVLLLEAEGKLRLDDDVRRFVPELRAYDEPVTLRHLLHHTSGYRDYLYLLWYAGGLREEDYVSRAEVIDALARQEGLNFPPGEDYEYSNSNYVLLGLVAERASGKTLREFAREKIFEPLGMRSTVIQDDVRNLVPHRAEGYAPDGNGSFKVSRVFLNVVGDGAVFTSVEDYLLWSRNLLEPRIGNPGVVAAMLEPSTLDGGTVLGYASGFIVDRYRGHQRLWHRGIYGGFWHTVMRFPDEGLAIFNLCNRSDAPAFRLAEQIAEIYLGERMGPPPEEPAPATADNSGEHVGLYRDPSNNMTLEIAAGDDGRLVARMPEVEFPLGVDVRAGGGRLLSPDLRYTLVPTGDGLRFFDGEVPGNPPEDFRPAHPPKPSEAGQEALAGVYVCPELLATVHLDAVPEGLVFRHDYPHRYAPAEPLVPVDPDIFANAVLGIEAVHADGDRGAGGDVTGFLLSTGVIHGIRCQRRP